MTRKYHLLDHSEVLQNSQDTTFGLNDDAPIGVNYPAKTYNRTFALKCILARIDIEKEFHEIYDKNMDLVRQKVESVLKEEHIKDRIKATITLGQLRQIKKELNQ